jgi:hypothetical protein
MSLEAGTGRAFFSNTISTAGGAPFTYSEGTWTPQFDNNVPGWGVSGISYTYPLQTGRWSRIGRIVTIEFLVAASYSGPGVQYPIAIKGIPYTFSNLNSYCGFPGWIKLDGFGGSQKSRTFQPINGTSVVGLFETDNIETYWYMTGATSGNITTGGVYTFTV